jgi:hypothetical protein
LSWGSFLEILVVVNLLSQKITPLSNYLPELCNALRPARGGRQDSDGWHLIIAWKEASNAEKKKER